MKRVHIVAVESDLEVQALRAACEYWGAEVSVTWAGNADAIVAFFSSAPSQDILILAGHGEEDGLCLPELAPEVAARYRYQGKIRAGDFRTFLRLAGNTVLNTCCCGGAPALAQAFLDAGAGAYVGHPDYPDGSEALMAMLRFLYERLALERPLAECTLDGGFQITVAGSGSAATPR